MNAASSPTAALDSILDDWRSRHRHWSLLEVFLPASQRHQAICLFAWYEAIDSATFEIRDDAVALAKLRWWREDLALAVSGQARHPLLQFGLPAVALSAEPWIAVVEAASSLRIGAVRPANLRESWQTIQPLAAAQVGIESALWGGSADNDWRCADLLLARLRRHSAEHAERSLLPLDLCARHALSVESVDPGSDDPLQRRWQQDWVAALGHELRDTPAARARASTLWSVATRLHLRALADPQRRQDITPLGWVWHAWRALRRTSGV